MLLQEPLWLVILLPIVPLVIWLAWRYKQPVHVLVSSLLLWQKLPQVQAGVPLKRRWRFLLSLLCYVLFIGLLALALSGPALYLNRPAPRHIIVIRDDSPAMMSTIGTSNIARITRWDVIRNKIQELHNKLNEGDKISIWPSERTTVIGERNRLTDFNEVIRGLIPAIIARSKEVPINLIIYSDRMPSDDVLKLLPVKPLLYLVGEPSTNKAIIQASATPIEGKPEMLDIFAMVKNYSRELAAVPVELYTPDGKLINSIAISIPAGGQAPVIFPDVPITRKSYRINLAVDDELALDNQARVATGKDVFDIWLVGPDNGAVSKALNAIQSAETIHYSPAMPELTDDVIYIFNGVLPSVLPRRSILINPPAPEQGFEASNVFQITGRLSGITHTWVSVGLPMRNINLNGVLIQNASKITINDRDHFIPLVKSGDNVLMGEFSRDGKYCLIAGFDVDWNKDSNWALMPSFPIFWVNVLEYINSKRKAMMNLCNEAASDTNGEMRDDVTKEITDAGTKEQAKVDIGLYLIIAAGCLLVLGWLVEARINV